MPKNPTHHLFEQAQAYVSLGIESFDLMKNWMNDIEIHVQANRFGNVENIGRNTWGGRSMDLDEKKGFLYYVVILFMLRLKVDREIN